MPLEVVETSLSLEIADEGIGLVLAEGAVALVEIAAQGPPGPASDAHYVHNQPTAATVWNVAHNLGKLPTVAVVDSLDRVVLGEIVYVDLDNLTVTFSAAIAGRAFCN